jgi:hypothetical protein
MKPLKEKKKEKKKKYFTFIIHLINPNSTTITINKNSKPSKTIKKNKLTRTKHMNESP